MKNVDTQLVTEIIVDGEVYHNDDVVVFTALDEYKLGWKDEIGDLSIITPGSIGVDTEDCYVMVNLNNLTTIRKATKAEEILWKLETEGDCETFTGHVRAALTT